MKKAGEILSRFFDKEFAEKAQGYSRFFDSWADITEKNGIGSAAAHSRIKDVDKGIVLIEMDHPGWKQILQTKQSKLLNDFRYRFPEMNISGISLMLGSGEQTIEKEEPYANHQSDRTVLKREERKDLLQQISDTDRQSNVIENSIVKSLDDIKDEEFKEKLRQLGQTIADSERRL